MLNLHPKHKLNKNKIENLIEQLPTPIILMENFHACSKMWGCNDTNLTEKILKSILEPLELCILNDKTHTYLHPGNGTTSAIDLTLGSPSIFMDFHWGVHDDQCGSNHSQIFLKWKNSTPEKINIPQIKEFYTRENKSKMANPQSWLDQIQQTLLNFNWRRNTQ